MGLLGGNFGGNTPMPNMQAIQQLANAYKQLQTVANPQMAQVMQMCNGKNPQEVFYSMCKQQGINPNDILNMFK